MKNRKVITTFLTLLILAANVLAQSGGNFTIEQAVIAGGGGQNSSGGSFSVNGTVGEPVAGSNLSGGTFSVTSGFLNSTPAAPNAQSYEADVASRPNGDNQILANDVNQMIRFLNEQDAPSTGSNEFQRADSAPFASRGNGVIDAADINQTIRYLNELDALQLAGGLEMAGGGRAESASSEKAAGQAVSESSSAALVAPELRVESASGRAGTQVSVNIRVDAVGNETQYAFAAQVQPSVLTFAGFAAGMAGATNVTCNTTATAGRIRCFAGAFPASPDGSIGEIGAGNNQLLLTLKFTIASGAMENTVTAVSLNTQSASDENSNTITPATTNGTVTVLGTTAAAVSVGGRVITNTGKGIRNAEVSLTDSNGNTRSTQSGASGYYRFDNVQAGETYIITARSKRFTFSQQSQILNVTEDINDINFIGYVSSFLR